jgi:hypothetical protein
MKTFFAALLIAVLNKPIDTQKDLWKPAPKRKPAISRIVRSVPQIETAPMRPENPLRRATYRFDGQALHHGEPCAHASIVIRVTSSQETITRGTITDEDGRYSIEINVVGDVNQPVDWTMQALTPDSKPVELVGRRIAVTENEPVLVNADVNFTPLTTASK